MEKTAFSIYLAMMVIGVLLFGAVHTYVYTFVTLGILIASVLVLLESFDRDTVSGKIKIEFLKTGLDPLFILILIFMVFQTFSLPEDILKYISSEAFVTGQKSLPASGIIHSNSSFHHWFSLAPYIYPVRQSIIRWTVYGLFFWGMTRTLSSRRRIEAAVFIILILACFETLYGLVQAYSNTGHIWWAKKTSYSLDVTGTYINRNHFAGLMEMCLLLVAGFAAALAKIKNKKPVYFGGRKSFRTKVLAMISGEQLFSKRVFVIFSGVVVGIGLIFSASRGGMISVSAGMLVMGLLFLTRKKHRLQGLILVVIFLLTAVYAINIGVEYPLGRFSSLGSSFEARTRYAARTVKMWEDYRVTGIGVGNFRYAYPRYQDARDEKRFIDHAHNDWIEFLAEAGIAGFILFLAGAFYYIYYTLKMWKNRHDPFVVCLGMTPVAVIAAMALHSYSDFNFHIPANCLVFTSILAIGYAAVHMDRRYRSDRVLHRYRTLSPDLKGGIVLLLFSMLILWTGFTAVRHFMAETHCNTVPNRTLNRDLTPPLEDIENAIWWDKANSSYWFKLALKRSRARDLEMKGFRDKGKKREQISEKKRIRETGEIADDLEQAIKLNPFNAKYHLKLGWEYTYRWKSPDYYKKWLPAADVSMERAAYFAGEKNPNLHVEMGNYWVMRSKTFGQAIYGWGPAWAKGCWHYKKALELESGRSRKKVLERIKKYVFMFYPDQKFVNEAAGSN